MRDDRFDVPTRDELIAALDKLLQTPRAKSDGGWANVSFERMHELDAFFRTVRKAVVEPDPDGAFVITWEMLHRAHHYNPAPGMHMPHQLDTPEKVRSALRIAASLGRATTTVAEHLSEQMHTRAEKT